MIHEQAYVECRELISPDAIIWQFASLTGETIIGAHTVVSPFAMLHGPLIGKRSRISGGVMMGPGFIVGDDVFIGPNVTLCNDAWPRAHKDGYEVEKLLYKPAVIVESGASIGANSVILSGVTIGAGSMVAAGSVVRSDVPPGTLWVDGAWRHVDGEQQRMRYAK